MKNRFLPICASSALLLAGCAVEEVSMEGGSIAAVMEDVQTRTAVTDQGVFTWSAGDKVWLEITANPGYVTGTLSTGAGTGSANFSYGTYFGDMTGKAVYPFNAGHDINGDELSVVLPASYDLGSNLSNTNAAMYGVETNGSIKFNHLAGVMRFKFRNVPVGTDKFILTLDKKINGTFTTDLTEDHPALQTESTSIESEKSITLNFDALTSVQDIMLYVPLPLGTYTTLGLEVKAGSQSVWSYSNTVTNTINRKSLILMPTVTLAGSISGDIEGSDDTVNLSESGTANSYVVSEAGSYKFTPTKGNSSESVGEISSAEVLWETFGTDETPSVGSLISEVSYEDGNIIFNTPESFREGNAVIAAKDANSTILWSWHIWLTDQPEEQVYYNNAGTMMDRNLGATSATPGDVGALGLLYQWGRKDPFLGASSISDNIEAKSTVTWPSAISSSVSVGTVDYVTANPTTFIMSSSADWCYSSPDNTLWQSEKSVYDPCPSGWRVPDGGTDGVWAKALGLYGSSTGYPYDLNNEGINFSDYLGDGDVIWYPAPGYRSPSDGAIVQVGFYCYAFSTTPELTNNGISAKAMMLDQTGYINPVSYMGKAHASVVRCFKEGSGCSVPEEPSEPEDPSPSQPSYSVQLNPSTYGWVQSTVSNPDASLYDGVYESTNQGMSSTKSIMYIDIDGYDTFTFYVRSYAESQYDYVVVSNLDVDITSSTSGFKMTTSGNQQSGTSLSSYTEVTFTNIGGGQHRIMVAYKKDHSVDNGNDKGYVLIPKNQNQTSTPEVPSEPQDVDYIDEYGINHGQGVEIDGVVWAPVNCGYHATDYKYGKLYQWGRKYGQGYDGSIYDVDRYYIGEYSDASVPSFVSGPVDLASGQSASNSNKFYYNSSSPYDWATPQDGTLWNSGTEDNPVKTEYDPCPEGWRVPTYAELSALKANKSSWTTNDGQNGYWFSGSATYSESVSSVFFPAAGYRSNDGGYAYYRGYYGNYLSSMPYSNYAYRLYFAFSFVGIPNDNRAYGYSVRCVQVTD